MAVLQKMTKTKVKLSEKSLQVSLFKESADIIYYDLENHWSKLGHFCLPSYVPKHLLFKISWFENSFHR